MADVPPTITDPQNGQIIQNYSSVPLNTKLLESAKKMSAVGVDPGAFTRPLLENAAGAIPASVTPMGDESKTMGFKVKLTAEPYLGDGEFGQVIFESMPTLTENRSVNYSSFTPTQHPGEILKYSGTNSGTWGLSVKLISRTPGEATDNQRKINILRSWLKPFFGEGTANNAVTKQYLGAPPPIVTLSAYGAKNVGPTKCVIETFNWEWPNDCDYINTIDGEPFPVIGNLTLNMKESWSPAEYSSFDLMAYRRGDMRQAFSRMTAASQSSASGVNKTSQTIPPLLDKRNISMSQPITVKNPLDIAREAVAPFTAGQTGVSVNKSTNVIQAAGVSTTLNNQKVNPLQRAIDYSNTPLAKKWYDK
jgi:hypothetical protein